MRLCPWDAQSLQAPLCSFGRLFFFGCLLKRPWVGEKQELCTKTDTSASNSGVNTSSVSFCIRPERGPEKHSESVASRRQQCLSWETTQKREKGEEGRTGALGSGSAHMWGFRTALKGERAAVGVVRDESGEEGRVGSWNAPSPWWGLRS